jgi:hypothetical protein
MVGSFPAGCARAANGQPNGNTTNKRDELAPPHLPPPLRDARSLFQVSTAM